ncbi:esterase-like activity of phytase family protein, partial [Kitasatospora indigofera]|uniref:esterase-like activity of phytase family protein n=1 Tax=Kitasatospora indigofera TaxID=67307 RepID=UPI00368D08DC
ADAGSRAASQPSILSATTGDAGPIGWAALGALSAVPGAPDKLYTASDSALKPSTIFTVDVASEPAVISDALVVTNAGTPADFDIEGLFARPQGGFWLASEGATGAGNTLYRTDAAGAVVETVALPADVTAHINKWGLEGVTATTDIAGAELVYVALQRPLWSDPASTAATVDGANITRIGRYDVAAKSWSWFGYELESPAAGGADWVGLSEIVAVDADTLAVIERDKLNGPAAANKRIYTIDVPDAAAVAAAPSLVVAKKTLALDVLPALRETAGWTQEKLEGLTIGGDGNVYAITDNDGLKDATGETVFLRLGAASAIFGSGPTEPEVPTNPAKPVLSLGASSVKAGGTLAISGTGFAPGTPVSVELHSTPVVLGSVTADAAGAISLLATIPAGTA